MVSTGTLRAGPPDTAICDGLTGAAWGLCRAGVASGCADGTGNPTACAEIEETYAGVTGEEAPWLTPPVVCRCDYNLAPKTEAYWADSPFFTAIQYQCPTAGDTTGAWFASGGEGIHLEEPVVLIMTTDGSSVCGVSAPESTSYDIAPTPEEREACRQAVIAYATEFMALNPGVAVNDLCTPTL